MREVYERAEQVIVWLGLAADASDAAMDLVAGDVTAGSEDAVVPGTFEYLPSEDECDSESDIQYLDTKEQAVTSSKRSLSVDDSQAADRSREELEVAWTGFFHLVQRPWWSRVWIMQEFAVAARESIFQCGDKAVKAQELRRIVELPTQARAFVPGSLDWETRVKIKAGFNTLGVFFARESFQRTGGFNLELILTSTTLNCQATNARDKVYGLLGLTSEPFRAAVVPDYSKSVTGIYTETSRSIININGRLDILSTNTASDRKMQPPLPSWVSDWALGASRPSTLNKTGVYSACGLLAAQVNPASPPEVLDAGGFHVDTIVSVTEPVGQGFANTDVSVRSVVRQIADHLKRFISRRVRAIPTDSRYAMAHLRRSLQLDPDPRNSDAFWRTLCADRVISSEIRSPAPEHFASLFELLLYPPYETSKSDRTYLDQSNFDSVVVDWPRLPANHYSGVPEHFMPGLADTLRVEKYVEPLVMGIGQALGGRVFFITRGGRMGIGPQDCKHGDGVAVLGGAHVPFVLRPERGWESGIDADVRLVGEAYVHGIMRGEVVVDALESTAIEGAASYRRFRIW
ncbi:hypothetical protein VSDG_05603 [Cytospora chrysosperma]|uniref:Heterokaryon incompatibility domain-containing protein n=1 Tax=Cytospora chrysosperma TaxID=252740 RepID=A0A423W015_CYTCH|nr:hypothetical protein VSDG_05603 [Valsa sordida]